MDDPSTRSILITLRADRPPPGAEAVVRAARYDFETGGLVVDLTEVGRIDDIVLVVHLWLRSFVENGSEPE